ncbi:MAG: HigA family addiction module antidote protein [Alphaproteobacteria bacterium]|nr:HigA family addiction module antidote protein [Alphaproteobacteria bacterium]
MRIPTHPGRLLKRELVARALSANRLAIAIGVPSGRVVDIINGRRGITADTALRLGLYFGNSPRFWLDLQSQHDLGVLEAERGKEIKAQIRPPRPAA